MKNSEQTSVPADASFAQLFRSLQPKFSKFYACILTKAEVTLPQYVLLSYLLPGRALSMTELSAKLHITKPAVTSLTDRLEKKHFLKRIKHSKDRRVYLLQIQPKGEKIVRQVQSRSLDILLKNLNHFSRTEQKIIHQFYVQLSESLDELLCGSGGK